MEAHATAKADVTDGWIRDVRRGLLTWGRAHPQDFPWRDNVRPWQGLVAELMLQRTRAPQVAPVFLEFLRRYPSAARFGRATEDQIAELIAPLGLRWRAPLLLRLSREIGRLRGRIPRDREQLEELPGIGPYAAAATLSLHCDERAVIVDSNVVRLLCRLVGRQFDGETRRKPWLIELADALTPPRAHRNYNYALLDLSMTICVNGTPTCRQCPLRESCFTGASAGSPHPER